MVFDGHCSKVHDQLQTDGCEMSDGRNGRNGRNQQRLERKTKREMCNHEVFSSNVAKKGRKYQNVDKMMINTYTVKRKAKYISNL
jgi:hypothetical protein